MTLHLAEISRSLVKGAHAVLVLDGAGWHQQGGKLRVPSNLTLLPLPRYAWKPNPVESVSKYLHGNSLSNTA